MSQCAAILAVLSDGRPHRMEEIHQRVGFCRLNSRVAELRGRGHVIECDKTGGNYTYVLVAAPESERSAVRSDSGAAFIEADGCLPTETQAPELQLVLV